MTCCYSRPCRWYVAEPGPKAGSLDPQGTVLSTVARGATPVSSFPTLQNMATWGQAGPKGQVDNDSLVPPSLWQVRSLFFFEILEQDSSKWVSQDSGLSGMRPAVLGRAPHIPAPSPVPRTAGHQKTLFSTNEGALNGSHRA